MEWHPDPFTARSPSEKDCPKTLFPLNRRSLEEMRWLLGRREGCKSETAVREAFAGVRGEAPHRVPPRALSIAEPV